MNVADPLDLAKHALRDVGEAEPLVVATSRARVLAAAGAAKRLRLRVVRVLLPIAAVLALSTAWASTHGLGSRVWPGLHPHDERSQVEAHAPLGPQVVATPVPAPTAGASSVPVDDGPPPIPVVPVELLTRAPGTIARSPAARPAHSAAAADDSRDAQEMALYARAHQAHFVDHDWGAALRAWDAYLAAQPQGRFVQEARYNRAIALVRLGRTAEAREALAPFAQGQYGAYHLREAREILGALDEIREHDSRSENRAP